MKLHLAWYALALAATTIGASPAPAAAPTSLPSSPPPQSVAAGFEITLSNMDVVDANGSCHMVYLPPALKVEVAGRRVVWACVR